MTSSLSDYSSSSLGAPAPADSSSLAALFPATGSDAATSDLPPEFSALMGAAPAPAGTALPSAPEPAAGIVSCASTSTRLRAGPALVALAATGVTVDSALSIAAATVPVASGPVPVEEPAGPAGPREVTRDMLEEAASFVASLLQTLLPEVKLPEFSAVAYQGGLPSGALTGQPTGLTDGSIPMPVTPANQETFAPTPGPGPRLFTLAADGAIELKLDLAQFHPGELPPGLPADAAVEICAELLRSGETAVRLEAAAGLAVGDPRSKPTATSPGREIFAVKIPAAKKAMEMLEQTGERNFVFAGDKQVKSQSSFAGITVAKTETTMPVAPTEETRFTRNPETFSVLPARVDFQVVVPPAERITVPAAAPAGQNFAERAVETVTNLVDTQFSASMQKSGSVNLQLRFGGEDLNVRVEIKDGAVHTDFRTDSAELRSALSREWQVLAAQSPEQVRRYLEPVFAPNSPSANSGETPSFAHRQQHQQQAQQDLPSRQARESWADPAGPFSRRSPLGDSFIPEPAVSRGPAFLPTTLRLSALA